MTDPCPATRETVEWEARGGKCSHCGKPAARHDSELTAAERLNKAVLGNPHPIEARKAARKLSE